MAQIKQNQFDFDILLAKPEQMKDLAKFARYLGPKGLMPNPKNGTVTPNPEARQKELEGGQVTIKTERKAPLIHAVVGKASLTETELEANIQALLTAFKGRVLKCTLCATMGPGIKVAVEK